ncbi:hypothetical protein LAZ67_21001640 [Cordylochernes scorpioides]|uniref:Uncharacterized protein n=1 Tax=Cordylochernes scorpioides TaxID=51811 RepID=A0ABY6LMF5_9ARAC|nr:hypothetical protein LAZ67_21001640 [Cordylochernes scorpioides]
MCPQYVLPNVIPDRVDCTTALALVYSVAEYCAPVWERSSHTDSIDAQLNQTMRLITGNMRPTPIDWLPYLSNIAPPDLRRKKSTSNLLSKIKANTKLPINTVLEIPPPTRLISRNPAWVADENVDLKEEWRNRWSNLAIANKDLVEDPNTKPPGYNLPRRTWSTLNRIRTSTGRCNYLLNKWNMSPDQNCDCGQIQTMHHILRDCPRRFFQGTLGDIHRCTEEALEAERKLKLFINNSQITHSEHPKYLGIHLDRTLTFKTHLTKLKGKLSSRNNILHKLAGSSWGSDANTLRTSALALIFSTAEYCAPVWEGSCHTKLIDTQLNSTLRIITGVCQPTRINWLPVLAHISPPELRRKEATKKMYQKLLDSPDLEINPILQGSQLLSQNFNISEAWTNSWISSDIPNKNLITSPSVKIPGFSLPRREWVLLNRFRTGQGRCAELMKLWGYTKDPNCACNVPQSMSHILDDCPLYKFNGGISNLHSVTPEALNWLKALPLRL